MLFCVFPNKILCNFSVRQKISEHLQTLYRTNDLIYTSLTFITCNLFSCTLLTKTFKLLVILSQLSDSYNVFILNIMISIHAESQTVFYIVYRIHIIFQFILTFTETGETYSRGRTADPRNQQVETYTSIISNIKVYNACTCICLYTNKAMSSISFIHVDHCVFFSQKYFDKNMQYRIFVKLNFQYVLLIM